MCPKLYIMKTFHKIVQGVLAHELGYGLMNGCSDPKSSYRATVEDQLYLHSCDKYFTLKTDVWSEIVVLLKAGPLAEQTLASLVELRNKLIAEHKSNKPLMVDMMNHYAFYRTRAIKYHNAIVKLLAFIDNLISKKRIG